MANSENVSASVRVCGQHGGLRCSRCHQRSYCSKECQKSNWKEQTTCKSIIEVKFEFASDACYREGVWAVCLLASLVLAERLRKRGINVSLKDGFYIFTGESSRRHVWLEDEHGHKIDVNQRIMKKHVPTLPDLSLVFTLPADVSRIDNETTKRKKIWQNWKPSWP